MSSKAIGYRLAEWEATFEVDDKGAPWKPDKLFRRGPLNYLRLPTVGTFARRVTMIGMIAPEDALCIEGLFVRLLRLVAGMDREQRDGGVIRGVDGEPAQAEEIAGALGVPLEALERALPVFTDRRVGLLQVVHPGENLPVPGNSAEFQGIPGTLSEDLDTESAQGKGKAVQEQEQRQEQEQAPGNSGGNVASAVSWQAACVALREAYGENGTINAFRQWMATRLLGLSRAQSDAHLSLLMELIEKSKTKTNPGGWFIGAVKKNPADGGFGYNPKRKS